MPALKGGRLLGVKEISPRQFAVFRLVLGLYLAIHFLHLVPWGPELWSREGVFPNPAANLTHNIIPNPLVVWDSPAAVRGFLVVLTVAALLFAAGCARHAAAVFLWLGWAALFNRNNLISNPSIPYVGFLLLATLLIPAGETASLWPRPSAERRRRWLFPNALYEVAWLLLMGGYTYSGLVKLGSPSWLNGEALQLLLANPLARTGFLRDFLLVMPEPLLKLATWGALATEILALPLALWTRSRRWIWLATSALQLGILLVIDFADLTLGMAMIHLFTFDPAWWRRRTS